MARFEAVNPVLPVKNVTTAIQFYTGRLGFCLDFQDSKDDPRYAAVSRDGVELHLQWHDASEWDRIERPMLRLKIDDVDALFEEYRQRGFLESRVAIRDTPWYTREFAFFDPDMNGLTFYRDR